MRSFSYSSKAHTHDVRTFCTNCSWVKLGRRCSTLPKWPLNIFWGFPWWYEHPALMPHWQHHLSSVYQPVFNSTPNMCGTDWEQLVLSSLFPWQLKILLYSKILSCYFYPPFFLLSGYIFPLKKAMGLISWTSPSAFIYSWSYLSVATHEKNTRDIFVHLQKWKTSLLTAVPNRISQWICHGLKCGPGTHAGTANPDGTPFWCLKKLWAEEHGNNEGERNMGWDLNYLFFSH